MKIAYVIDYLYGLYGGTETQLYNLIHGMVSRGHSVHLYVLRDTEFTRNLSDFPCPIHSLGINSVLSLSSFRKLWQFRKSVIHKNFDIVHGFFNDVALALPPLMLCTGVKSYTSRRDMGIWYNWSSLLFLRLFRFSRTEIICNSQAVARLTEKKEWKPKNSIHIIYNGIFPCSYPEKFNLDWVPANNSEKKFINVVLLANIRPIKRIEDLIKAASKLNNEKFQFRYYIVGHLPDHIYYSRLQSLLSIHNLENIFHFVGAVSEPRLGLPFFDIGVLTSESEGLSNSILEYLYAGLPVVVSKVGGNPELVTHGHNGFLYDVGQERQLADYLRRLAMDVKLRHTLANNSRQMTHLFNYEAMVDRHEVEYKSA